MKLRTRIALYLAADDFWELIAKQRARIELLEDQQAEDPLEARRLALQLLDKFMETLDDPDSWEREIESLRMAQIDLRDELARLEEHAL